MDLTVNVRTIGVVFAVITILMLIDQAVYDWPTRKTIWKIQDCVWAMSMLACLIYLLVKP